MTTSLKKAGYTSHDSFAYHNELSRRHYWAAEKGKPITLIYLLRILDVHKISVIDFYCTLDATKIESYKNDS